MSWGNDFYLFKRRFFVTNIVDRPVSGELLSNMRSEDG